MFLSALIIIALAILFAIFVLVAGEEADTFEKNLEILSNAPSFQPGVRSIPVEDE